MSDPRKKWRVAHPLPEVLLLVGCGTIAFCDDYDDIGEWGKAHLPFLRRFLPFHHGIPCHDWLRTLMNRIDPAPLSSCLREWWPGAALNLIAHRQQDFPPQADRAAGKAALYLVSAFATNERLVFGQEMVADHSCEQEATRTRCPGQPRLCIDGRRRRR